MLIAYDILERPCMASVVMSINTLNHFKVLLEMIRFIPLVLEFWQQEVIVQI